MIEKDQRPFLLPLPKNPDNLTATCTMRMSVDQKYILHQYRENTISVYKRDEETRTFVYYAVCLSAVHIQKDVAVFPDGKHIASVNHDLGTIRLL